MSGCEVDRASPLFEAAVAVAVGEAARSRTARLVVGVLRATRDGQKMLRIEITDEQDLLFLYTLDITAEDFLALKQEQSILVEFDQFAAHFIELLQRCRAERREGEPYFVAKLQASPSVGTLLSVAEVNRFKELTHLSLRLREGTDASLKHHLASRLRHVLAVSERQAARLEALQRELSAEQQSKRELVGELESVRAARERESYDWQARHASALSQREKEMMEQTEALRSRYESEIRSLRQSADAEASALSERCRKLEETRARLTEEGAQLRSQLGELRKTLDALTERTSSSSEESQALRARNRALEDERLQLERDCQRLQLRCEALEQQVRDKEQAVATAQQLQRAAEEAQRQAQESLELYKSGVASLQAKLEESVSEIHKGNRAIKQLQEEQRALRDKVKLKNQVIAKQEKILEAERKRAADLDGRIAQLEAEKQLAAREQARLEAELAAAEAKLQESRQLLESNQQVITWLNKELNGLQQARGAAAFASSAATTSPFGTGTGMDVGVGAASSTKGHVWWSPSSVADVGLYTPAAKYTDPSFPSSSRGGGGSGGGGERMLGSMTAETERLR